MDNEGDAGGGGEVGRWQRVKVVLADAMELSGEQRAAFLDDACGDDPTLRAEVESLLVAEQATAGPELLATGTRESPTATEASEGSERGSQIGPYRLLQKIGEGGMGEVWLAEQREPVHRRVALKVIKPGMDSRQVIARFEAERQALAMMDHPAVAKVFDAGTTPRGRPYFVMEYVKGVPITEHCDRQKLTTTERLELFREVCEGVQHAHHRAIIHRDIKPSNVLVAESDGKRTPKIIDFGVAKATTHRLTEKTVFTELGLLIGTPEYMSPEQAEMTGEDVDTRTDVYSLGVLLYELLTGALPFDSRALREAGYEGIRRKIREEAPSKPSARLSTLGDQALESALRRRTDPTALERQLRGDLDWIVMKALEKDRARRYGSPSDLGADLERYLGHLPVLAGPPSTAYRVGKFVRRHRLAVAFVSAGVLVLLAFAATMAVQAKRIAGERDRANREAAVSKDISRFLVDLFESSDPGEARGRSITAREVLDRGRRQIESSLDQQDDTRARLMVTMGAVYQNLGLYDDARPLLEEALQLQEESPDTDPSHLAENLRVLADLHTLHFEYVEAESHYRRALEIQEAQSVRETPELVMTLLGLGGLYSRWGRDAEQVRAAVVLLERALAIRTATHGRRDAMVADGLHLLGLYGLRHGGDNDATALLEEAVTIRESVLGADHPDLANSLHVLGLVRHRSHNDARQAESLFRRALQIRVRVLGTDNPYYAQTLVNLADVLTDLGRREEARSLYAEAAAVWHASFGEHYRDLTTPLTEVANAHILEGDLAAARPIVDRVLGILDFHGESQGVAAAWALVQVAACHQLANELALAEETYDRARDMLRTVEGMDELDLLLAEAQFRALTGDRPAAIRAVENAVDSGADPLGFLGYRALTPLWDDPRFDALLDRALAKEGS